jgi:uncharacterized protein (TIGR02271 family)
MNQNTEPNRAPESINQIREDSQYRQDTAVNQSAAIPVIEEHVHVDKQLVEKGVVRVSKRVYQENVDVDVPLIHEEHDVNRVPVNQYVDTPPAVRYEGETMIIPVLREEVIVQKRLVLVEELHITKKLVQTQSHQQVTLRKEEVVVDRDESMNARPGTI